MTSPAGQSATVPGPCACAHHTEAPASHGPPGRQGQEDFRSESGGLVPAGLPSPCPLLRSCPGWDGLRSPGTRERSRCSLRTCIRRPGGVIPGSPPGSLLRSPLICEMGTTVAPRSQDNRAHQRDCAPWWSQSLRRTWGPAESLWILLVPSSHAPALSLGRRPSWSQCGCQEPPLGVKSPPFHLGRARAHDIRMRLLRPVSGPPHSPEAQEWGLHAVWSGQEDQVEPSLVARSLPQSCCRSCRCRVWPMTQAPFLSHLHNPESGGLNLGVPSLQVTDQG